MASYVPRACGHHAVPHSRGQSDALRLTDAHVDRAPRSLHVGIGYEPSLRRTSKWRVPVRPTAASPSRESLS